MIMHTLLVVFPSPSASPRLQNPEMGTTARNIARGVPFRLHLFFPLTIKIGEGGRNTGGGVFHLPSVFFHDEKNSEIGMKTMVVFWPVFFGFPAMKNTGSGVEHVWNTGGVLFRLPPFFLDEKKTEIGTKRMHKKPAVLLSVFFCFSTRWKKSEKGIATLVVVFSICFFPR